jgi:pimeloyl-ACP methyl ester carboxylesterase
MPDLPTPKIDKVAVFGVNLEVLRLPAQNSLHSTPIVFLHEGLGSVAMWRDFPQKLCQATGRAALVYSRRGYGQSDARHDLRGTGRLRPDYMHREALEVLPELLRLEGIQAPILLGHSDGGTIALLHASQFEAQACIVMAPHLFVEDISIAAITQAREAYETGDLRQRLAPYHADVDNAFWQWNDIWLSHDFRSFNIQAECKKIRCPLLAIQGYDDPYGSLAQIEALAADACPSALDFAIKNDTSRTPGVKSLLLKLERCGHAPHRDQANSVIAGIQAFLFQVH